VARAAPAAAQVVNRQPHPIVGDRVAVDRRRRPRPGDLVLACAAGTALLLAGELADPALVEGVLAAVHRDR
jgi:hypothetical protein